MRWSPEDGEGGLRRVLLPRPLVRRKATIKSTHTMRYSPLVKPERKSKATRRFLIKNKENQPTASYTTHPPTASQSTCPQVQPSRAGRYRMPRHPRTVPRNSVIANQKKQGAGQSPPINQPHIRICKIIRNLRVLLCKKIHSFSLVIFPKMRYTIIS